MWVKNPIDLSVKTVFGITVKETLVIRKIFYLYFEKEPTLWKKSLIDFC